MQEKTKNILYAIGGAAAYALTSAVADRQTREGESRFDAAPAMMAGSVMGGVFMLRGLVATFHPALGELFTLYGIAAWEAHLKAMRSRGGRVRAGWGGWEGWHHHHHHHEHPWWERREEEW